MAMKETNTKVQFKIKLLRTAEHINNAEMICKLFDVT